MLFRTTIGIARSGRLDRPALLMLTPHANVGVQVVQISDGCHAEWSVGMVRLHVQHDTCAEKECDVFVCT